MFVTLTIVGWLVAFFIGAYLNKRNLKQQTIIETIKYIHDIKQSILDNLSRKNNLNTQFITQKIKKIRILLKEVLSKKLYEEKYNLIINTCRNIMKKQHENSNEIMTNKIMIELHRLDELTLLYPFHKKQTHL